MRYQTYFNPRSPRGGATNKILLLSQILRISIHAPHEGERLCLHSPHSAQSTISIHAPHEGERLNNILFYFIRFKIFQSTLPTRGSDLNAVLYSKQELTISIHAPHEGERRIRFLQELDTGYISIHAPHEGERRCCSGHKCDTKLISIHAPHEGERLVESPSIIIVSVFQSTLPTRGSDFQSMHALRP